MIKPKFTYSNGLQYIPSNCFSKYPKNLTSSIKYLLI